MEIDAFVNNVEQLASNDEFSGAIMLSQQGHVLYEKAYGQACKSFCIPNIVDTKFNIASVGKVLTGVAIAQLVQKGAIKFSDRIYKFIGEDWIKKSISNEVTIEHLLTHTSGYGDYFPCTYGQTYEKTFEATKDYQELITTSNLHFKPGTCWSYSNIGFLILGLLIENITQTEYGDYISKELFSAAGMENSGYYYINEPINNKAIGYYRNENKWRSATIKPVVRGTGSGGCYSTVADLTRFMTSLQSGDLLNHHYLDIVLSPKPNVSSFNYGYGFFIDNSKVFHSGDGTGVSAHLSYYKKNGCILSVLSNYSGPSAGNIVEIFERNIGSI